MSRKALENTNEMCSCHLGILQYSLNRINSIRPPYRLKGLFVQVLVRVEMLYHLCPCWYCRDCTKNCNHFSRTLDFQGPPTRNIISQIVQKCIFPVYSNKALRLELFASPTSLHVSVYWS